MGSRSSRFFVIVLHLVGVSYPSSGIVAVWPWPVALEPLQLWQQEKEAAADVTGPSSSQEHPIWLQDTRDGRCLGPTGTFMECGDATLWLVERHALPDHRNNVNTLSFFLLDRDDADVGSSSSRPQRRTRRQRQAECLDAPSTAISDVVVGPCRTQRRPSWQLWRRPAMHRQQRSSLWTLHEDGTLQPASMEQQPRVCLRRDLVNEDRAILGDCHTENEPDRTELSSVVQFSFLQYKTVSVLDPAQQTKLPLKVRTSASSRPTSHPTASTTRARENEVPARRKKEPVMFPEMKDRSNLLFQRRNHSASATEKKSSQRSPFHLRYLSDTNPILLTNTNKTTQSKLQLLQQQQQQHPSPTDSSTTTNPSNLASNKLRRIQTHPYLMAAHNEIWTDPQTQLEYYTDLNTYLGRTPEQGRQTLTGMGIYRKGYVIKVYGIAFYVSNKDVLADPALMPYASLTAEELRGRKDFYALLRTMGSSSSSGNFFERTILLKTNMQLSAETMRSSLQADWSYLTEEAKALLASTGMQNLPADEAMLDTIQSPDNPSRCSCSQTAPESYQANPDCCARGTELGFTWTKENVLEVG